MTVVDPYQIYARTIPMLTGPGGLASVNPLSVWGRTLAPAPVIQKGQLYDEESGSLLFDENTGAPITA